MRSRADVVRRVLEYLVARVYEWQRSFRKKKGERERRIERGEYLREAIDDCGEMVSRCSTDL